MSTVVYAPNRNYNLLSSVDSIFLAGSIDMGNAIDWQQEMIDFLKNDDVVIFNPRRQDWDSTWEQTIDNQQFREQVTWEHDHIALSDVVLFVFDPNGAAPITLMELGWVLGLKSGWPFQKIYVCCPEGYWRKGNVDILCARYDVPVYGSLEELKSELGMNGYGS